MVHLGKKLEHLSQDWMPVGGFHSLLSPKNSLSPLGKYYVPWDTSNVVSLLGPETSPEYLPGVLP